MNVRQSSISFLKSTSTAICDSACRSITIGEFSKNFGACLMVSAISVSNVSRSMLLSLRTVKVNKLPFN